MLPLPQISVRKLAEKLKDNTKIVIMDVREPYELEFAKLNDEWVALVPLSKLAREGTDALPENLQDQSTEIIVMCHTGQRSAQVTSWLRKNGWNNVYNLTGGIAAYARQIDPSVGFY